MYIYDIIVIRDVMNTLITHLVFASLNNIFFKYVLNVI